jgi:hypothetical protein
MANDTVVDFRNPVPRKPLETVLPTPNITLIRQFVKAQMEVAIFTALQALGKRETLSIIEEMRRAAEKSHGS